jgi:hypothetical protein
MGTLAQVEFGLADASKDLRYWYQRRELAEKEIGYDGHLITAMEKAMYEAIAIDLVARWEAMHSPNEDMSWPEIAVITSEIADDEEGKLIERTLELPIPRPKPFGERFDAELAALVKHVETTGGAQQAADQASHR